jgi:pilus assembly protein Flp/PilA
MFNNIKRLMVNDEGATLVEYGLIVALIAALCVVVVATLGGQVKNAFSNTSAALTANGG